MADPSGEGNPSADVEAVLSVPALPLGIDGGVAPPEGMPLEGEGLPLLAELDADELLEDAELDDELLEDGLLALDEELLDDELLDGLLGGVGGDGGCVGLLALGQPDNSATNAVAKPICTNRVAPDVDAQDPSQRRSV